MPLINDIPRCWQNALDDCPDIAGWRENIDELDNFLQRELAADRTYHPNPEVVEYAHIFRAFRETCFNNARVIIIGQDPYPEPLDATGLAFSLPPCEPNQEPRRSKSVTRIYNAIEQDYVRNNIERTRPDDGNLIPWARQGVLLLNRVLTFYEEENNDDDIPRAGRAENTHMGAGWEYFTEAVVKALSHDTRIQRHFMLWGVPAHELYYENIITNIPHHTAYLAAHPTAGRTCRCHPLLTRCSHFFAVNRALGNADAIDWFPRPPIVDR